MIVNPGLAAWLGDPCARRSTDCAMRTLAGAIAGIPAVAALRRRLDRGSKRGPRAVLELARGFIEDDAAIEEVMEKAILAAALDPFCRPPLRASRNEVQDGLLLFGHRALGVQLAVTSADALAIRRGRGRTKGPIIFTGQHSLFRFVKSGEAVLSWWTAADGRCRADGLRRLADGDTIALDGRRQAFLVEHAASDLVYLEATTPLGSGPVAFEVDPQGLEPVAATSTDEAASRGQMMLALLRAMERADAAPLFARAARDGPFHARWQAMREFLALDAELALPHLRRMAAKDPHEEVRAAAAETLAAFFPSAQVRSPCLA